jgi:hypothetical protein
LSQKTVTLPKERPWMPGLRAIRRYLRQFLLIQALAGLAVVLYYVLPGAQQAMAGFSAWRESLGAWYAVLAYATAGGIIPELANTLFGHTRWDRQRFGELIFHMMMFATIGLEVHFFYIWQAEFWGADNAFRTVLAKLLTDMILFTPFISTITALVLVLAHEEGFRLRRLRKRFTREAFTNRYVPMLVLGWGFWGPVVIAVYAMPLPLQLVVAGFAQAAYSLIFVIVARERAKAEPEAVAPDSA